MITLADIIESIRGTRPEKPGLSFKEVTSNSKRVHANSLYIALPGDPSDGHEYVGDAFHRGARAAIVQKDLAHLYPVIDLRAGHMPADLAAPKVPFCLRVEDTGSALEAMAAFWCRKINPATAVIACCQDASVVNDLLASILTQRWPSVLRINQTANPPELCLDLLHLQPLEDSILIEIQPDKIDQMKQLVDLIHPRVALIDHSIYLGEKADLCPPETFQAQLSSIFSDTAAGKQAKPILNYDIAEERKLASQMLVRPIFYGLNPFADLWADEIEGLGEEGILFHIHYRFEQLVLRSPILGRGSVHIALQAAAAGLALGLTWQEIANGLLLERNGLRLIMVTTPNRASIIDDTYSNSVDSAFSALNLIKQLEGRKIAVLGEIIHHGSPDVTEEIVGTRAAEICNIVMAVGEKARRIIEGARRTRYPNRMYIWAPTPSEAVNLLKDRIQADDIILVKGSQEFRMDQIVTGLEAA